MESCEAVTVDNGAVQQLSAWLYEVTCKEGYVINAYDNRPCDCERGQILCHGQKAECKEGKVIFTYPVAPLLHNSSIVTPGLLCIKQLCELYRV